MTQAYPLQWPDGLPRTERKAASLFKATLPAALKNVADSLVRFGGDSSKPVTDIVISSNISLGENNPADTGISVWFNWDGAQRCIAVDRYPKAQDNLQAIHHIIEARRTEMRHGGLHIVRQTFKGFVALPAPSDAKGWRQVLNFKPNEFPGKDAIDARFREMAERWHPDKPGGSEIKMAELNKARSEAKAALT
jgi:hypothetical protein